VPGYKVLFDDKLTNDVFDTADEAIAACKLIVDELLQPGMTATALSEQCARFNNGPFVVPVDPNDPPVPFSAWAYAKERCQVLGAKPPLVFPADWEDVTAEYSGTVLGIVGVKPPEFPETHDQREELQMKTRRDLIGPIPDSHFENEPTQEVGKPPPVLEQSWLDKIAAIKKQVEDNKPK
jgi:hypothetical protein